MELYFLEASCMQNSQKCLALRFSQLYFLEWIYTLGPEVWGCRKKTLRTPKCNEGCQMPSFQLLGPSGAEERTMKRLQLTSCETSGDHGEIPQDPKIHYLL